MTKNKGLNCMQWRRIEDRGGKRDPFYTPERDLAYIGPAMLKQAVLSIDLDDRWEPWLKEVFEEHGITVDTLTNTGAPSKLAKMLNLILKERTPTDAAKTSGFSDLPGLVQLIVYARIGQIALAGIWTGVKDVNMKDSDPPASIADLYAMIADHQDANMVPAREFGSSYMSFVAHYTRKVISWIKEKADNVWSGCTGRRKQR